MKNPQDNKRNLATRRTAAEGGDTRNVASKPFIDPSEQVNDRDLLEAVCADLCRGKLGRYPIFGFGLKVEERGGNEEKFAVLVFYGCHWCGRTPSQPQPRYN